MLGPTFGIGVSGLLLGGVCVLTRILPLIAAAIALRPPVGSPTFRLLTTLVTPMTLLAKDFRQLPILVAGSSARKGNLALHRAGGDPILLQLRRGIQRMDDVHFNLPIGSLSRLSILSRGSSLRGSRPAPTQADRNSSIQQGFPRRSLRAKF